MESSHTSNSNATNAAADKPDELVSSGDIRQMNAAQVQHGEPVTQAALQQLNQQPKKCLHHRIFDASAGNMVNERVAALTNALLQQANQQNLSQGPQITQRPFPMQQQPIPQQQPQQTHIIRPHQQMQQFQQYAMQQMPTSIGINNSMMQTNAGTHFSVGISNQTANPSTSSTNGSIIHNQNGLVQQMNAALLAERYLLLDLVEGSTLYKCIDVKTHEELVCKGDLHSYVRVRKRLREPEAKRLFRQMCEVVKSCHEQGIVLRDLKLRKFVFADAERFDISAQQYDQSGGYVYEKPAQRFDLPQPVQQYDQDGGYVYEKPVQRFELPQPMQQYDQDGGYVYEKPVQRFDLPQPTTPAPIQSTYLPPTTRRPTPPQTPKPSGYFYPAPTIRFDLPQKIVTTQKPFVQSTYLPPTTPAPKYIPPKQGYSYPKPAVRFDLPQKIVTTPKPFVQSTYLPPTTKAPKVEGYVYPKPTIRFDLPAPIRSTFLPPTTTTTRKPSTSAPKYIPPKVEGYVYEKPAIRFDLPAPIQSTYLPPTTTTTTPKPTTSAPKYIPPKEGYSYPKPAIRFDLPSPIQSTYLPPTTTTPKPKEGYSYPKPVVRLELPSTYLPPTTTTTSTTPAPTYLPPRFQTPESDGYFYPQPQITFEF